MLELARSTSVLELVGTFAGGLDEASAVIKLEPEALSLSMRWPLEGSIRAEDWTVTSLTEVGLDVFTTFGIGVPVPDTLPPGFP